MAALFAASSAKGVRADRASQRRIINLRTAAAQIPSIGDSTGGGGTVRSLRAHVVFVRGPAQVPGPFAKPAPFTIATLVPERSATRPRGGVLFGRAPAAQLYAKASPLTIIQTVAGEATEALSRVRRDFPSTVIFGRNPAGQIYTKAEPSTVASLVTSRQATIRRPGRVVFERNPAAQIYTKAVPVALASLVSESASRRPKGGIVFVRNAMAPAAPQFVKAPPAAIVTSISTAARSTRRPGRVATGRNPAAQLYTKAVPFTIATLVPERQPITARRFGRIVFARTVVVPVSAPTAKAPPFTIATLAPKRHPVAERRLGYVAIWHNPLVPPAPPAAVVHVWVYPEVRDTAFRLDSRPGAAPAARLTLFPLEARRTVFQLDARPRVVVSPGGYDYYVAP